jgi:hypothetical protein
VVSPAAGEHPIFAWLDPCLGRLALPGGDPGCELVFTANYGFAADLGGGYYPRTAGLTPLGPDTWRAAVYREARREEPGGDAEEIETTTLAAALNAWREESGRRPPRTPDPAGKAGRRRFPDGVIRIYDSASLDPESLRPGGRPGRFEVVLGGGQWLAIEAVNQRTPAVIGDLVVRCQQEASLSLNGLWIDGSVRVEGPCDLLIDHCTVRPASGRAAGLPRPWRPALEASAHEAVTIHLRKSIVGPLRLPAAIAGLLVEDSIVDAGGGVAVSAPGDGEGPGPATALLRSTVFGEVRVSQLPLAADALLTGPLVVEQTRYGEVIYSYLPAGSVTPRRQRCQPDLALAEEPDPAARARLERRLVPSFTSTVHGDPGYAQLAPSCPPQIGCGGQEGSEMGVFHDLYQPQRQSDLAGVVAEYAPWGFDVAVRFVT